MYIAFNQSLYDVERTLAIYIHFFSFICNLLLGEVAFWPQLSQTELSQLSHCLSPEIMFIDNIVLVSIFVFASTVNPEALYKWKLSPSTTCVALVKFWLRLQWLQHGFPHT